MKFNIENFTSGMKIIYIRVYLNREGQCGN